jgi:thiamine-monophosphate kinase
LTECSFLAARILSVHRAWIHKPFRLPYSQEMQARHSDFGRETPPGELGLIRRIRERAANAGGDRLQLGIGDDCALLRPRRGEEFAITTDLSIAGRHFRLDWHTPDSIGHRTLARGLSDLAAMGAKPVAAFLSLGLPRELTASSSRHKAEAKAATPGNSWPSNSWIDRFLDGLLTLAAAHQTPLAGGDLSESPVALADIVLVGAVPSGKALLRSGARAGDLLYVTGALGGAAAGLARLAELAGDRCAGSLPPRIPKGLAPLLAPHLYPQPRVAQGLWLQRRSLATAAMDLSDGLSTDLAHLCHESAVAAEVDAARLPIHYGATLEQALHGGEDYELLFTARAKARIPRAIAGVPITQIGRIVARKRGRPIVTLTKPQASEPLVRRGWEHFS